MTITERFAKYTVEELEAGIKNLESRVEKDKEMMDAFEEKKDIEMFRSAEGLYNDDCNHLMDARWALNMRKAAVK